MQHDYTLQSKKEHYRKVGNISDRPEESKK
jgi:hypothetical protein